MVPAEAKASINVFLKDCEAVFDIAKTALRNNQSLNGNGYYGNRFRDAVVTMAKSEVAFRQVTDACQIEDRTKQDLFEAISRLKSASAQLSERVKSHQEIRLICNSSLLVQIEQATVSSIPTTEQVIPLAVVRGTRGYLERLVTQANGCYEYQWYDACSVMIRKLVEILIIELYETKGRAAEIKDTRDEFLTLRDLVLIVTNETSWSLGRETKRTLPLLKELGDRSAHTRRYLSTKTDVDKVLPGLRVVVDEFIHLSNLK